MSEGENISKFLPTHFDLLVKTYQTGYEHGAGRPAPALPQSSADIVAVVVDEAVRVAMAERGLYLMWRDDSKKPTETKICEAIAAYAVKFDRAPNVVLCNEAQRCEVPGVQVRSEARIGKDLFHVGWEAGAC